MSAKITLQSAVFLTASNENSVTTTAAASTASTSTSTITSAVVLGSALVSESEKLMIAPSETELDMERLCSFGESICTNGKVKIKKFRAAFQHLPQPFVDRINNRMVMDLTEALKADQKAVKALEFNFDDVVEGIFLVGKLNGCSPVESVLTQTPKVALNVVKKAMVSIIAEVGKNATPDRQRRLIAPLFHAIGTSISMKPLLVLIASYDTLIPPQFMAANNKTCS
jgi:hypothetical protein